MGNKTKKSFWKGWLLFFVVILGAICTGSYFYGAQSQPLAEEDVSLVVKGHDLLVEVEEQFVLVKEQPGQVSKDYWEQLVSLLASYRMNTADPENSEEGQRLLNRYYTSLQQLGENASMVSSILENPEQIDRYFREINRAKEHQQAIFTYYRINEEALQQK